MNKDPSSLESRSMLKLLAFGNLKVRHRLWLGFSILIVMICTSSAVSLWLNSKTRTHTKSIFAEHLALSESAQNSLLTAENCQHEVFKYSVRNNQENAQGLVERIKQLRSELENMVDDSTSANSRTLVSRSISKSSELVDEFQKIQAIARKRGLDENSGKYGELNKISDELNALVDEMGLPELNLCFLTARQFEKEYLIWRKPELLEGIESQKTLFSETVEMYALPDQVQQQGDELWQRYLKTLDELAELNGSMRTQVAVFQNQVADLSREVSKLVSNADEQLSRARMQMNSAMDLSLQIMIWMPAVSILLAVFISMGVTRSIQNPLNKLKILSERERDLSVQVDIGSNCEFGEFSTVLNRFVGDTRITVQHIKDESHVLHQQANVLMAISRDLTDNSDQIAAKSVESLNLSQSLSETLQSVSEISEETSKNIENISNNIVEFTNALERVSGNCANGDDIVSRAEEKVNEAFSAVESLEQSSISIHSVVDTIHAVADQINLLSLNATIEAASAGDAGKGFAVVASEVKALAKQSSAFATSIRDQIEDIQTHSTTVVRMIGDMKSAINDVKTVTKNISGEVQKQTLAIGELSSHMNHSSESTRRISQELVSASGDSARIVGNFSGLHRNLEQSSVGLKKSDSSARELGEMSDRLSKLVGRFKL